MGIDITAPNTDLEASPIMIDMSAYDAIGQGTWAIKTSTGATTWVWYNSTNADADNITYKVYIPAGDYDIAVTYASSTSGGIVDFYVDGTERLSIDTYAGAGIQTSALKGSTFNIATSGLYDVKIQIDGQNGASGGHYALIHHISLFQT
jgi:hypothetical protein